MEKSILYLFISSLILASCSSGEGENEIKKIRQENNYSIDSTKAWKIFNSVEEIKVLQKERSRGAYDTLNLSGMPTEKSPNYTFDITLHDTIDHITVSIAKFYLNANTGKIRLQKVLPQGQYFSVLYPGVDSTMAIEDWIKMLYEYNDNLEKK